MIMLSHCSRCGHDYFPAPLACFSCGRAQFGRVEIENGTIEEITPVEYPQPALLASVRVAPGVVVIAALQRNGNYEPGAQISLDSAPGNVGTAYVPSEDPPHRPEELYT